MPDMEDQLFNRMRTAAKDADIVLNSDKVFSRISNATESTNRRPRVTLALALGILGLTLIATQGLGGVRVETPSTVLAYGPHDTDNSLNTVDYIPDFWLPWFGSSGSIYELKVPTDFQTRIGLVRSRLAKSGEFRLLGSGHWGYTNQTIGDINALHGTFPRVKDARNFANELFVLSGFSGDLSRMKFHQDSDFLTASCELLLDGKPTGLTYSVSWARGGKVFRSEGWVSNVIRHENIPVMSPRQTVGFTKWRDEWNSRDFFSLKWDGVTNPVARIVSTVEEVNPKVNGVRRTITQTWVTSSSPNIRIVNDVYGNAWIVPSFVFASGKTILANVPAVSVDYLNAH